MLGLEDDDRAVDNGLQEVLERPPALDLEREVDERLKIARHGGRRITPDRHGEVTSHQPSGAHS